MVVQTTDIQREREAGRQWTKAILAGALHR